MGPRREATRSRRPQRAPRLQLNSVTEQRQTRGEEAATARPRGSAAKEAGEPGGSGIGGGFHYGASDLLTLDPKGCGGGRGWRW